MEIKELADQLQTASKEIKDANDAMKLEIKSQGVASAETKALVEVSQAQYKELKEVASALDAKLIAVEQKQAQNMFGAADEYKSAGQLFVESSVFTEIKSSGRGSSNPFNIEKKDVSSLAASAGALIRPDRDSRVFQDPNRPLRIRDLIPTVPTASNAVEFMRENVFTNNAAPQGTVAGLGAGEFVTKAKSEITYELVTKPVRTIAHWMAASRQVLSDAPMLQNLIDGRLAYGLDLKSDQQLLLGDGTGQNLDGLVA